jgi:cytochrome c biogenesis protein CcmG/thiol:disulfide interchange protein DsbE
VTAEALSRWGWGKWAIPLSVVPVLILLAYGFRTDPRAIPSPLVGKPAVPFAIALFDGGRLSFDDLKGKVVVLNFWASWCFPACYDEAPVLEGGWRTYKDRGVVVVGVNIQDKEEPARKFLQQFSITFPNGPDPTGRISVDYGVYGVPETFFIDRAGRIRLKHVGAVTEEIFTREVGRLLGEGG